MIHYKLHTNEGTAWCGRATGSISNTRSKNKAVTVIGGVTCPDCLNRIKAFDAQMAEAQKVYGKQHRECRR